MDKALGAKVTALLGAPGSRARPGAAAVALPPSRRSEHGFPG